jgi:site-specific recombinase XerD
VYPVAIVHEWNTIPHLNDYEGDPEARPFTREELQRFLDYADEQVEKAVAATRKGALAAYRDATLFKVLYGWGLRRTEASKLGRCGLRPEPGGVGVRPVRDAQRPLRQGQAWSAAPAPERRFGDGVGGGGGG